MNQPEENSKLTTNDYLELMKAHGIEFEGRIVPGKWRGYTTMFEEIRHIGKLRPEEMFHSDDEYLVEKRIKASDLVKEAWNCLETMDSEYGWRKEVEFRAFNRFDSEVICHICLQRRWKSKFEAEPIDPTEAEFLQNRRKRRRLCTCTLLQQSDINVDDQCSRLFSRELDKHVDHEDMPEHIKKRLRRQRPDRVIGLGATRTLRHYLPNLKTRYSPFKKTNVIYPFIVIESKTAESRGASFGSILRQTAFVVRTCLRLQQNLREETRIPHQCIVWSFAIMGEEWRLYAAVPNGSKVQIFDLWHGTVLFPEGALQLLLIIDYLCDWASEVYRMSVIRCLTGGSENPFNSRLSPSGTDTSSLVGDADTIAQRAMSLPSRSSLPPELMNDEMMELVDNNSTEFAEIEPLVRINPAMLSDRPDIYSWQRWTMTEKDPRPWVQKATIRHSNLVEFSYLQVTMPEEIHILQTCLDLCFPDLSVKDAARKLLTSLQDDNMAVTTSVKATSWQGNQLKESTLEVRALVYFRSVLKGDDWQITRQMLCILCSEKAVEGLAQIAELSPLINGSWVKGDDTQCKRFLQAINSLNLIGGTRSVGLALVRRQLSLRAVSDSSGSFIFEWNKFSPERDDVVTGDELCGIMSHTLKRKDVFIPDLLTPYIKKKWCSYTVPVGSDQEGPLAMALEIPNFRAQGILIKKPKIGWAESAQDFCFLIINGNVRFDEETKLGQLLEECSKKRDVFTVEKNAAYDNGDRAFIDLWVRILKGQLPQDTPLK